MVSHRTKKTCFFWGKINCSLYLLNTSKTVRGLFLFTIYSNFMKWVSWWTFTLRLNRRTRLLPYKLNLRLFFLLSKIQLFRRIRLILTFKSSGPLREKIMYVPCISKIMTNLGINLLEYFIIKSLSYLYKNEARYFNSLYTYKHLRNL